MHKVRTKQKKLTLQNAEIAAKSAQLPKALVDANVIGATYSISTRYVLKLAAEGRIPCLRLGRKCVRFDPSAVAAALEAEASRELDNLPKTFL